jgi:hypothetical protein
VSFAPLNSLDQGEWGMTARTGFLKEDIAIALVFCSYKDFKKQTTTEQFSSLVR